MSIIDLAYLFLGLCTINHNFFATCDDIETISLVTKYHAVDIVSREAVKDLALSSEWRAFVH